MHQQAATTDGEATGPDRSKQNTAYRTIKCTPFIMRVRAGRFQCGLALAVTTRRGACDLSVCGLTPPAFAVGGAKACCRLICAPPLTDQSCKSVVFMSYLLRELALHEKDFLMTYFATSTPCGRSCDISAEGVSCISLEQRPWLHAALTNGALFA